MEILSLAKLNEYIGQVIEINFDELILVRAEVHQCNSSRGHYYLDLVEKAREGEDIIARQSGILWRTTYQFLRRKHGSILDEILRPGNEISFRCQVDFHSKYGLKLILEDIDPGFTLGELERKKRQVLEEVRKRGLEKKNAAIPIPPVLQRIAVISSRHAAGYADFLNHLTDNPHGHRYKIHLYQSAVQGQEAEEEIVGGLLAIEGRKQAYDCVCILRGGGSKLDLAAFDSLRIAEAVASFPLPVISGIGHEIDTSITDLVAHTSVKTPTAVAGFLLRHNERFLDEVWNLGYNIAGATRSRMQLEAEVLSGMRASLLHAWEMATQRELNSLASDREYLIRQTSSILEAGTNALERVSEAIRGADPRQLLEKGYSITIHNNRILRTADAAEPGEGIQTLLHRGQVRSVIRSKSDDHG